jgi:protein-disulfide isomerase
MPNRFGWRLSACAVVFLASCSVLTPQPTPTPMRPVPTVSPAAATVSGRTRGDPNAPVTLVVYSDFQCPYCKDFADGAEHRIDEELVKTGRINFTYKYFPVIDNGKIGESHWAAQAAECANEQNKFWQYHDKLYAEWRGENKKAYTPELLKVYAAEINLDVARFNPCVDSGKYASLVAEHEKEANLLNLPGTPMFLLNGRRIYLNSLEYADFYRQISPELK